MENNSFGIAYILMKSQGQTQIVVLESGPRLVLKLGRNKEDEIRCRSIDEAFVSHFGNFNFSPKSGLLRLESDFAPSGFA